MILELIEKKKEELKASKKWEEYNRLKKEERDYKSIKGQGAKLEEKKHEYDGLKRYTILKREYLKRGLGGYFNNREEIIILRNATDKQIEKKLAELNKGKRARFFRVERDFKTATKKGMKEFKHYLVDEELL